MSEHDLVHLINVGDNGEASVLRSYLQHHGVQVHVQGENHRSLLGMVGAYIELSIMVPASQFAEATELLVEYHAGTQGIEPPEMRGPHRDQFEDEDDDDEWKNDLVSKRAGRRLVMAALIVPFGGGHLAAGAWARGLVLAGVGAWGIARGLDRPAFLGLWGVAVAMDLYGSRQLLRKRKA